MFQRFVCFWVLAVIGVPAISPAQEEDRDPTVPKPNLLKRLAPVEASESPNAAIPQVPPTLPTAATPKIWKLKLKSLVMTPNKSGRATVEIGDQRFSLELPASAYRAPVLVPANELTSESAAGLNLSAPTVHSVDTPLKKPNTASDLSANSSALSFGITPSVIQVDGLWLQLVSHFDDVLVFRIVETGKLLIAR
jgi:hypothetical protein